MKPKFLFNKRLAPLFALTVACSVQNIQAASGIWTGVASGGNWSAGANWSGGTVADGAGSLADFSTLDLPAGAFSVNLDSARTIGSLSFGDLDGTTAGTWALSGANTLTLASSPAISIGVTTTISPILAGTSGFTKSGAGNLILTNANTVSGSINLTAGQLTTKNGAGLGTSTLTLGNGTHYRYERTTGNGSTFVGNAFTLAASSSATITTDNAANGYSGLISGDANSTLTIGATGLLAQCSFGLGSNTQQLGSFLGRVEIFDGASIRFSSTSNVNNGGAAAIWDTNTSGTITTRNSGTVNLGSLVGNGTLTGSGGANGTTIFAVGARNEDCVFGGIIQNANADRLARLTKVGSAKLTLTGANTYTAQTNVDAGTLEIGNGGTTGSLATTNIVVASGANLDLHPGISQSQSINGIISGTGNLTKKGAGRTTLAGVNTITTTPTIEGGLLVVNANTALGNAANPILFELGSGKLASDIAGLVTARACTIDSSATGGFAAIDATDSIQIDGTVDGGGALEIGGLGVVSLTAGNTYLGNTTVTSGTLVVANTTGSATSAGSVSVTGGNLAGVGTMGGSVSIASGAGAKPGPVTPTSSAVGILNTGSLNLNGGSTIFTEFASTSSYDQIVVTGDLASTGASVGTPVLVDLRLENSVAKWTNLGTYNLIQYSGTFSGNANELFEVTPASQQAGLSYTFAASGGFITLTIAGAPPSEWNVDGNGNWSSAVNWLNGLPNGVGVNANFGTVITGPVTVTNDAAHAVGSIQFNNDDAYTLGGASVLTLDASTGNAQLGILVGSHEISAPISFADPVDITFASLTSTLTLSGNISGSGGLNSATPGLVVLSGTNSFGGPINLSAGSLNFDSGSLGTGALTLANSSLVWATGNTEDISSRSVSIGGTSVTLDTNGNNVVLANAIGAAGEGGLVKNGAGRLTLASDPTFTGSTTISGGVLQLGNGGGTGIVEGIITNNAGLAIKLEDDAYFSNLVTGTGSLEHAGTGILNLGAQNTHSGNTTVTSASAVLRLSDAFNLQNSTVNLVTGGGSVSFGTLTAARFGGLSGNKGLVLENSDFAPAAIALTVGGNNQNTTYTGILSGSGSLVKTGTSILTLGGVNTFTGDTTVNAGELLVGSGGSLVSPNVITPQDTTGFVHVVDGSISATSCTLGRGTGGLFLESGSVSVSGVLSAMGSAGSTASAPIRVSGGSISTSEIRLGRTGLNDTNEPAGAPINTNLYLSGGLVSVSGNLHVGSFDAQPNSSVVTRIDGGTLTVGGAVSIGQNNGGRWSYVDVNGGDLVSTASGVNSGIVLGGPFVAKSALLMRSGTATVERIQLGRDALGGMGLLRVSGGDLYVGSEGIVLGTTQTAINDLNRPAPEPAGDFFRYEIRLTGGTLAAKAAWSTALPINLAGTGVAGIKAADITGVPYDITLNGALTGTAGLEKSGIGVLNLNGGHAYGGNTSVYEGRLRVATNTFSDTSGIIIYEAATLELAYSGGDKVASLVIGGVDMATGVWGAPGSGAPNTDPALVGTGLLYVGVDLPVSGYDAWASTSGLTVGVNDGPAADPDFDGISNLLEFVLGGNPLVSSTDKLPELDASGTDFVFTFLREDDSEAEVALTFQHGSDLSGWTDVAIDADGNAPVVAVSENADAPDDITVTIPKGTSTEIFGRLRAVK